MTICYVSAARTYAISGVLLILVGMVGSAAAQPAVSVRGNVGASFFRGPDLTQQILHSGANVGVEVDLHVGGGFAVTLGGMYDGFTLNEENARLRGRGGSDVSFVGGSLGIRYTFRNRTDAHPYVTLGGGLYQRRSTNRKQYDSEENALVSAGQREVAFGEGVHLGLGSLFRLDDTYAVFVEPRYTFFDVSEGVGDATRYFALRLGMDMRL
jgi:hypothetical protein